MENRQDSPNPTKDAPKDTPKDGQRPQGSDANKPQGQGQGDRNQPKDR